VGDDDDDDNEYHNEENAVITKFTKYNKNKGASN